MRTISFKNRFRKEFKKSVARGYRPEKLHTIMGLLELDEALPPACRPHKLSGEYEGLWECHIGPDWLLIYELIGDDQLILHRTGTHADLFK